MDPLTAISEASAIVQFVDFSSKLIVEGHEIYQSIEGASRANLNTENITNHIDSPNKHLQQSARRYPQTGVSSGSENALRDLVSASRQVATDLKELLDDPKVSDQILGAHRKWDTFR